jgi:hypothetical protein
MIRIAAALAACVVAQAAAAATVDRKVTARCSISGYLKDQKGADIRGAPRAGAPVIGRLPPPAPLAPGGDERFGAEFDILGARSGWVLIAKAEVETDDTIKTVFEGPGWLPGDKVDFVIGSQELRTAPANNAKVIAKLMGETEDGNAYGPDSYRVLRLHGCQRHFVDLTIAPPRGARGSSAPMRGWVNKVCSNQKTTCDPAVADSPNDGR